MVVNSLDHMLDSLHSYLTDRFINLFIVYVCKYIDI